MPIGGSHPVMPVPAATQAAHPLRISSMQPGSLIHRVEPLYPAAARNARIQGPVVLEALVSKTGTIENLRLVSGHPLLVTAAIEAVRQWRYKPYILNEEAIEVETRITVNFVLAN
jgi:protein TonB